jgi:hypothetical protein
MKRQSRLMVILLAALVLALSYLGGALAPPLRSVRASSAVVMKPFAADVSPAQWEAVQASTNLLLSGDDPDTVYLPLIRRQR